MNFVTREGVFQAPSRGKKEDEFMQRISRLTILLLALLLLFCQGCRRQTAALPTDNIYHLETDYQDSYKGVNAVFYFADTPEGTAYNGFGRLYLLSGDTAMPQLCCFRPECRHASYADDCPASLFSLNDNGFQYMNGKFYYIAHTANKAQLCRMDVTGENHEILREEPGALLEGGSGLVFHRGFLYIYCVEELSEQSSALKLYQLDLENPASEMKLLWSENIPGLAGAPSGNITARGHYLFFQNKNNPLYADAATTPALLHSLDLQTGNVYDCVLPQGEVPDEFAVVDDRVFVSVLTEAGYRLTSFSYTFEERTDFPKRAQKESFRLCGDPQYLYLWWMEAPLLYILDKNGQPMDTLDISFFSETDIPIAGIRASMLEDGRVFITASERNWGFHYFEKSEIGSGQIQLKGLAMVCLGNQYTEPVPMPDDFTWDWDRYY